MWKKLKWLAISLGTVLMFMANIGPGEATSHIAHWVAWLGLDKIALYIDGAATDQWGFFIGGGLVAFSLIIWIVVYYREKKLSQKQPKSKLKQRGSIAIRIEGGTDNTVSGNIMYGEGSLLQAKDTKNLKAEKNVQIIPKKDKKGEK